MVAKYLNPRYMISDLFLLGYVREFSRALNSLEKNPDGDRLFERIEQTGKFLRTGRGRCRDEYGNWTGWWSGGQWDYSHAFDNLSEVRQSEIASRIAGIPEQFLKRGNVAAGAYFVTTMAEYNFSLQPIIEEGFCQFALDAVTLLPDTVFPLSTLRDMMALENRARQDGRADLPAVEDHVANKIGVYIAQAFVKDCADKSDFNALACLFSACRSHLDARSFGALIENFADHGTTFFQGGRTANAWQRSVLFLLNEVESKSGDMRSSEDKEILAKSLVRLVQKAHETLKTDFAKGITDKNENQCIRIKLARMLPHNKSLTSPAIRQTLDEDRLRVLEELVARKDWKTTLDTLREIAESEPTGSLGDFSGRQFQTIDGIASIHHSNRDIVLENFTAASFGATRPLVMERILNASDEVCEMGRVIDVPDFKRRQALFPTLRETVTDVVSKIRARNTDRAPGTAPS
jgi:hypothetical protein